MKIGRMNKVANFIVKHPVAITVLLCFIFYFLPFKPKPFGDGEYHEGTIQLIQFILNGFEGNIRVDKGLLTLFYYLIPYSLAYVFHSNEIYYLFGIIFNFIITCWAVHFLFLSFKLMNFSNKSLFFSILILSLFPIHIYYAFGIWAETAAFFAVSFMIYNWIKISFNPNAIKYFLLLSCSLIILVGTRPNFIPFLIIFLIYILFLKFNWKNKFILIAPIALFFIFSIAFEKKVNHISENFKHNVFTNHILWSRFELRDEPFNWLPQHGQDKFASSDYLNNLKKRRELDSICEVNHLDKTTYYLNWVKQDIIQNPGLTVRQYFLKFFQSQSFIISPLMKSNKSNYIKYGVHLYLNSINYILVLVSLFGMYLLAKNQKYKLFFPFLFLWGGSLLYVFIFHSEQRYMFPMRPLLIFLFTYSLNHYFETKKRLNAQE